MTAWGLLPARADPSDGAVCLDYVRLRLWPPGEDGKVWAYGALELILPTTSGEQGVVVQRGGKSEVRVWWRRDQDRPGLRAVDRD